MSGSPLDLVRSLLDLILFLFFLALLGRLVFDWIQVFSREWRPKGPVLVAAEGVYTVTDPPLKALRKVIPPLRIGGVAIDLAFMVLFVLVMVLRGII
ncbi:MAG: YggT family protein [Micrococcales bacterium]|nr:YggT family protein [Micrococcales bacterium]